MPKVVQRFRMYFTIVLLLRVVATFPDLATRPAYGVGVLLACATWAGVAAAALRGSDGARKFIVFISCVGMANGVLGAIGGALLLVEEPPVAIVLMVVSALTFFLQLGLYKSATDDSFRAWVVGKAALRQEAKLAAV